MSARRQWSGLESSTRLLRFLQEAKGAVRFSEIVAETGINRNTVKVALRRLRLQGLADNPRYGEWIARPPA